MTMIRRCGSSPGACWRRVELSLGQVANGTEFREGQGSVASAGFRLEGFAGHCSSLSARAACLGGTVVILTMSVLQHLSTGRSD
jgi:hypothetical protein